MISTCSLFELGKATINKLHNLAADHGKAAYAAKDPDAAYAHYGAMRRASGLADILLSRVGGKRLGQSERLIGKREQRAHEANILKRFKRN